MRIVLMTNTYTPHVGGVARSVEAFARTYRKLGHQTLVIAPEFENRSTEEEGVIRLPAIQNFNGSDFSVRLPVPGLLSGALDEFGAEIIHSHHPFLIGDTALRVAAMRNLPIVFTHHTMYEQYTHYVPGDSPALQRFVVQLSTGYANLCDHVIVPSESVGSLLRERGVESALSVVPTGVEKERFARGDGRGFRRKRGIPRDAFVVGHVGRLAPEKNLRFLAESVAVFLAARPEARFLVVGSGPAEEGVKSLFRERGVLNRLVMAGSLEGQELVDGYHAMDVFAFASLSETQGMVITEAMAAGAPVVALDAPGAREVVSDGRNGRLLAPQDATAFAGALAWVAGRRPAEMRSLQAEAKKTAEVFSLERTAQSALEIYADAVARGRKSSPTDEDGVWAQAIRFIDAEWQLWVNVAKAATAATNL